MPFVPLAVTLLSIVVGAGVAVPSARFWGDAAGSQLVGWVMGCLIGTALGSMVDWTWSPIIQRMVAGRGKGRGAPPSDR